MGGSGQKEERALTARLLSPAASRRRCSTQGLGRKEKDGKRRDRRERKKERMRWRRDGWCLALSGGLKMVLTEQERADKGQKGPNLPYLWWQGKRMIKGRAKKKKKLQ